MAPEVLNDNNPTQKVDIWAAGVIFYELISALKHPFEA
jgi:serine/threonine protein kinase